MEKTVNNKAWFLVIPVFVIVAFSAIIPLMTVVNFSVQDIFGPDQPQRGLNQRVRNITQLLAAPVQARRCHHRRSHDCGAGGAP